MHYRNNKKTSKNVSLDESIGFDKEGNEITLVDMLKTPAPDFIGDITVKDDIVKLKKYMDILSEREKNIIIKRYGLDGNKPKTLEEVGDLIGLTRERIRQILNDSYEKIRNVCENQNGNSKKLKK